MSDIRSDDLGPIELLAVAFPGSKFTGDIIPRLGDLVDRGIIRVLDLVVVKKGTDGVVDAIELDLLDDDERNGLVALKVVGLDILADDDLALAADQLEPGTTAALLVWEDVWAAPVAAAIRAAGGIVLAHERVPSEVIAEVLEGAI